MEFFRRLILLVCVCAAIWLAYLASLEPLVVVRPEDFIEKYKKEIRPGSKGSLIASEDRASLSRLTLSEYITKATKGRIVKVQGKEWDEFFKNVNAFAEGKNVGKEWTKRLPNEQHPLRVLFFKPVEPPLNTVQGNFKKDLDNLYLALTNGQKTDYLNLEYKQYSNDDFRIGSGFSPYPDPPSYLLYPYRQYSLWIVLIGLALYIFLPRNKKPDALRYPSWRIVLGDGLSLLLIVTFFTIPILIIQGSMQIFKEGWILLIFFWPLSLLGIYSLKLSAWFASYQLILMKDRLQLSTYKGDREYLYSNMLYFQPIIFKPPRWLIILAWMAALSGKGAARKGGVGRAMILSGSEAGSIGIAFRDGSYMYINITDQMGNIAFPGAEKILDALKEAEVTEKKEQRVIRSMGFETVGFPAKLED